MSRSNAPLALSVVKVTVPGNIELTAKGIMQFDGMSFGFSHDQTWRSMPKALRGLLSPEKVAASLTDRHPRIVKCVRSLCALGALNPKETRAFVDYPDSGIRPVTEMHWGPDVIVKAKASCWYINEDGQPVIPILQPRKEGLSVEQLSVYVRFARQAFCKNEWVDAITEVVDLSGDDNPSIHATVIPEASLPYASDDLMADYVKTYMAAKEIANVLKKDRVRNKRDNGMNDLFDPPAA